MSVIELKPCAHCGGRANIESFDNGFGETAYTVECILCGVGSKAYLGSERAIAEWNTRADGWISVGERSPEPRQLCLTLGHGGYYFLCQFRKDGWRRLPSYKQVVNITHWMPLPNPPAKKGAK